MKLTYGMAIIQNYSSNQSKMLRAVILKLLTGRVEKVESTRFGGIAVCAAVAAVSRAGARRVARSRCRRRHHHHRSCAGEGARRLRALRKAGERERRVGASVEEPTRRSSLAGCRLRFRLRRRNRRWGAIELPIVHGRRPGAENGRVSDGLIVVLWLSASSKVRGSRHFASCCRLQVRQWLKRLWCCRRMRDYQKVANAFVHLKSVAQTRVQCAHVLVGRLELRLKRLLLLLSGPRFHIEVRCFERSFEFRLRRQA